MLPKISYNQYTLYAIIHILSEKRHVKCTMKNLSGLGKLEREKIISLLCNAKYTVSVAEAAKILSISSESAAKLLSRLTSKGWFSRIKRGIYVPVPLDSITANIPLEDPWIIAESIYNPCYIGGWSAAEHWSLTEQIYRTILVYTANQPRDHSPNINGTDFLLRTTSEKNMFGLKPVWRGQMKVFVSDPSRTIVDLLVDPVLAGGIRNIIDLLLCYLKSEYRNIELLIQYAKKLARGSVFKRLGFLLEQYEPKELQAIELCRDNISKGKIKLDPSITDNNLISRWQLWVPKNLVKKNDN